MQPPGSSVGNHYGELLTNQIPSFQKPLPKEIVFDFTEASSLSPVRAGLLKDYEGDQFNVAFIGFQDFIKPTSLNGEIVYTIDKNLAQNGTYPVTMVVTETVEGVINSVQNFDQKVTIKIPDDREQLQIAEL